MKSVLKYLICTFLHTSFLLIVEYLSDALASTEKVKEPVVKFTATVCRFKHLKFLEKVYRLSRKQYLTNTVKLKYGIIYTRGNACKYVNIMSILCQYCINILI
jgi:hypothetical protein